jgi:hypothetical protein
MFISPVSSIKQHVHRTTYGRCSNLQYSGPTLGGVITTQSSSGWIFLFNIPVGVFIMALMFFAWPHTQSPGKISWRQLDVIGCLLCIAASVMLVFALQQAGAGAYAWSSITIIATLAAAAISAVALGFWIWYLSSGTRFFEPLFPVRVVLHRVLATNMMSGLSSSLVDRTHARADLTAITGFRH